ncbi:class I SAM-dependent methyltransferase [Candidatus Woesebacteria bacterium]|nr:class I SAM-dependent methyltransferase [Candidatus Woesebacteria bacterium]
MPLLRILFWLIEIVLILGVFSYCVHITGLLLSFVFEVPYVPSSMDAVKKAFQHIHPPKDSKVLEIGCGDGRVLCSMVKKHHLYGRGIDKNPIFVLSARVRSLIMRTSQRTSFITGDGRVADVGWADIIYLFMLPKFLHTEIIKSKLLQEAKQGAFIISHWYEIDYLKQKEVHRLQTGTHETYVYKI